jgi:hypothetical protein
MASTNENGSAAPSKPAPTSRQPKPTFAQSSEKVRLSGARAPPETAAAPNSEAKDTAPMAAVSSTTQAPPCERKLGRVDSAAWLL